MVQRNNTIAVDGSQPTLLSQLEHGKFGRVQIIRTLSKAGIPQRIPTIYRTDSKLLNPSTPRVTPTGQEDHSNAFHAVPTIYQLPTIEQSNPDIPAVGSSNSLPMPSTSSKKRSDKMHSKSRPKIQVVIPTHPVKNPEFLTRDTRKAPESGGPGPTIHEPSPAPAKEPVTATTPITIQPVEAEGDESDEEQYHDAEEVEEPDEEELDEEEKAAAAHQRSISTGTDSTEQTHVSDVSGSSASRHSASSESSVSSVTPSPEKETEAPSKGQSSRITVIGPITANTTEVNPKNSSGKTHVPRKSIEEAKNKPLPPEPSREVAPLLLRKKPSRENLMSSPAKKSGSPSKPLVSKFSSRELNNLDRNFERSAPRPVLPSGQTRMHLVQAARDLENQLNNIPDPSTFPEPKDESARSIASDERTLVASFHERSSSKLELENDVVRNSIAEEAQQERPTTQGSGAPMALESFLCDGNDGCPLCDAKEALQGGKTEKHEEEVEEAEVTDDVADDNDVIAPDDAALLLLYIMENLDDLSDLFAAAFVNRGFYLTFKKHELRLYQSVIRNMSPAAWELRDVSPPWTHPEDFDFDGPVPDYTPSTYLHAYSHDTYTITDLKSLILARCETFLRLETVTGLSGMNQQRARELDDAFWRIWTFCRIFGCRKDREYDLVAQMDWLNGGPLARSSRSPRLRPTSIASENFLHAADSALFSPSKNFGVGNGREGLSATQLYDMIEIWNCLGVLVQQLSTNVSDAKKNGVFEKCDVNDGAQELKALEEWTYYILTLGPSVILSLSCFADQSTASAFTRAKECGWTKWTPPSADLSRSSFLKEALTRVYNDRLSKMSSRSTTPESNNSGLSQEVPLERSDSPGRSPSVRDRQLALAEELRQQPRKAAEEEAVRARQLTKSASFNQERPMSDFPNIITQLALKQSHSVHDHELPIPVAMEFPATHRVVSANQDSAYASTAQRIQQHSRYDMTPHRWPAKTPKPNYSGASYEMQRYQLPEPSEEETEVVDPVDFALWTLTSEHGFSKEEAVWALRKFETGESVDVDKAVALLLRQRELGHPTTKRLEAWTGGDDRTPVAANASVVWSRPEDLDSIGGVMPRPGGTNPRNTVIISPIGGSQTCCPHCSAARLNPTMSPITTLDSRPKFTFHGNSSAISSRVPGRGTAMSKEDTGSPRRHLKSVRDVYSPLYRTYTYVKGAGKGIRQVRFTGPAATRSGSVGVGRKESVISVNTKPATAAVVATSSPGRLAELKRLSVDLHRSIIFTGREDIGGSILEEENGEEEEGRQGSIDPSIAVSDGGSDKETVLTSSSMSVAEKEVLQQRRGESPVSSLDSMVEEKQKVEYLEKETATPKTPTGFVSVPYSLPAMYR